MPPPPRKKLPQQSPAPPAGGGTHAKPPPPPPAARPPDTSQAAPKTGAEPADPANPNAPSANQAEAAGAGDNTTNPADQTPAKPVDTDPLRFIVNDEPGQQAHSAGANGTEALYALMGAVGGLRDQVPPEMWESVAHASNHLADGYRQANFGQHEGAVTAIGHAANALDRARQAAADPDVADKVGQAYDTAVDVGNTMRATNVNANRPPWNPLPVKQWKGLPVLDVEGKAVFPLGTGRQVGTARCAKCGTPIAQDRRSGGWADRTGRAGDANHTHSPGDRQRDDHGRFA